MVTESYFINIYIEIRLNLRKFWAWETGHYIRETGKKVGKYACCLAESEEQLIWGGACNGSRYNVYQNFLNSVIVAR